VDIACPNLSIVHIVKALEDHEDHASPLVEDLAEWQVLLRCVGKKGLHHANLITLIPQLQASH